MSNAATTHATPLPADIDERTAALKPRTPAALKALALKAGVPIESGWKKPELVAHLAANDDAMRAFGWAALAAKPEAGTGNIDEHGDVIGSTPADPYDCDEDGFPADKTSIAKLDDEHLDALVFWIERNLTGIGTLPADAPRDTKIAFIVEHGYEDDETEGEAAAPVHIPTAAPAPTTITEAELHAATTATTAPTPDACACNGRGGYETDTGWEPCTHCDGAVESTGQLTLMPGGDAPAKSILNIGALRHDLGTKHEFKDGDRVRVTFELVVDKIAFVPEKSGGEAKRRVRTHAGAIDPATVTVESIE